MDKIQECAARFLHLVDTTSYVFHLAKRNVRVFTLWDCIFWGEEKCILWWTETILDVKR